MKTVLISGASGFCGQHLIEALQRKRIKIFGLSRQPSKSFFDISWLTWKDKKGFWEEILEKVKPDLIFHLAAVSVPRLSFLNPEETFRVNVLETIKLSQAILKASPKTRLFLPSTIQVYGKTFNSKKPLSEESMLFPESPYAASKAAAEVACLSFLDQGLDVVIARSTNFLGKGQSPDSVFSNWCRQVAEIEQKRQKPVLRVGFLSTKRSFLHVQDAIRAFILIAEKGQRGSIYNVAGNKEYLLKDFLGYIVHKSKLPIRMKVDSSKILKSPSLMRVSNQKIKRLGWQEQQTPWAAVDELLESWRNKKNRNSHV